MAFKSLNATERARLAANEVNRQAKAAETRSNLITTRLTQVAKLSGYTLGGSDLQLLASLKYAASTYDSAGVLGGPLADLDSYSAQRLDRLVAPPRSLLSACEPDPIR